MAEVASRAILLLSGSSFFMMRMMFCLGSLHSSSLPSASAPSPSVSSSAGTWGRHSAGYRSGVGVARRAHRCWLQRRSGGVPPPHPQARPPAMATLWRTSPATLLADAMVNGGIAVSPPTEAKAKDRRFQTTSAHATVPGLFSLLLWGRLRSPPMRSCSPHPGGVGIMNSKHQRERK